MEHCWFNLMELRELWTTAPASVFRAITGRRIGLLLLTQLTQIQGRDLRILHHVFEVWKDCWQKPERWTKLRLMPGRMQEDKVEPHGMATNQR